MTAPCVTPKQCARCANYDEEHHAVPCRTCGHLTLETGMKLCHGCWEVEHRLAWYLREGGAEARAFVTKTIEETSPPSRREPGYYWVVLVLKRDTAKRMPPCVAEFERDDDGERWHHAGDCMPITDKWHVIVISDRLTSPSTKMPTT